MPTVPRIASALLTIVTVFRRGSMNVMARGPRPLVIAEAANPDWPSVPLVGWNLGRALVEYADAHVVTQVRNREAIERAGWREGREYTALDSERIARPAYRVSEALRKAAGLGMTVTSAFATFSYYYFEQLVWRRFGADIRAGKYDVVHRITPLTLTIPSLIARHCSEAGVPFVWGPLNGGVQWPKEFKDVLRAEGEWLSYLRSAHKLLPGYRSTRVHAAATIVGSVVTWQQFRNYSGRTVYIPENGIDPSVFPTERPPRASGPLRVVFVGRLVPLKGVDMLVEAAAPLVRSGRLHLEIVGDGPEMPRIRRLVEREKIAGDVAFSGWLEQRDAAIRMGRADVLAFPSVREFGGGAVLEAMALGVAPVIVDYAGPSELISDQTGYRVPIGSRELIIARFREVLTTLAAQPELATAVGEKARLRVARWFTWEAKVKQVMQVYEWVLRRREKPTFGMPFPDETLSSEAASTESETAG